MWLPPRAVWVEAPAQDLTGVDDEVERGFPGARRRVDAVAAGVHSTKSADGLGRVAPPRLAKVIHHARVPEVPVEDDEPARFSRLPWLLRAPASADDDDEHRSDNEGFADVKNASVNEVFEPEQFRIDDDVGRERCLGFGESGGGAIRQRSCIDVRLFDQCEHDAGAAVDAAVAALELRPFGHLGDLAE